MKNTLCCLMQNRLGALDRLLGTLTHRGFLPESMMSTLDFKNNRIQVVFTFDCGDEKALEKLVKSLHKQVYVIEIRQMFTDEQWAAESEDGTAEPPAAAAVPDSPSGHQNPYAHSQKITPLYAPVTVERRASHGNR